MGHSHSKNDKIVSSQSFPSTSLCALFVPARLHHAATILDLFQSFKSEMNTYCVVMFVFSGWFAGFFDAVTPSKKRLSIDDGTTLRISTFHKDQLKSVYLPELFRKAGRTTEQYFHAFQSLLSLHHDCFDLCPINSLLKPNPNEHQPTSDEWDHIDLETIVVAIRTINDDLQLCDTNGSMAARTTAPPSINVLGKINFLPDSTNPRDSRDRDEVFLKVCRLCSQRVVSLCLGRMGFFSRFVSGLVVDDTSDECERVLRVLVNHEEGWQDALEFNFVQTSDKDRLNCQWMVSGETNSKYEKHNFLKMNRKAGPQFQAYVETVESQTHLSMEDGTKDQEYGDTQEVVCLLLSTCSEGIKERLNCDFESVFYPFLSQSDTACLAIGLD
ncbi:hypothetical protein BLNAU_15021 [Blattamonas nauphoetae]|uniref:Uncharacterized protein n=1 Tax=Blattamonas nauphoetae TaxID=2049346 RepID=A0ABQ9XFA4_9EUKA|nr:hypothetical protein BLNAU_15021 [Blattamonas nauphoetae]